MLSGLQAFAQVKADEYSTCYKEFQMKVQVGLYEEAEKKIRQCMKEEPLNDEYRADLASLFYLQEDMEKAVVYYDSAILLNSGAITTYFNRARCYYALEKPDETCKDMQKVIELDSGDVFYTDMISQAKDYVKGWCDNSQASYYYQRGIAHFNLENYKEAIEDYDRGIKKFPDNILLYHFKGNAYAAMEENSKAEKLFQYTLNRKGMLLSSVQKDQQYALDSALANAYTKSLIAALYNDIGTIRMDAHKYPSAIAHFDSSIAITGSNYMKSKRGYSGVYSITLLNRAWAHSANGTYDLAEADFRLLAAENRGSAIPYIGMALVDLARKGIAEFKKPNPKSIWAYADVEIFIPEVWNQVEDLSQLQTAENYINNAISLEPNLAFAKMVKAFILQAKGEDGCEELLKAKKLQADHPFFEDLDCEP